MDTGENPEVPFPRDMIDLEVSKPSEGAGSVSPPECSNRFPSARGVEELLLAL